MPPLYLTEQGARLEIDNRRAQVTKDGQELASVPLIQVTEVVILGNVGITTPAIKTLLAQNIDVVFLTLDGAYCGRLVGPATPHVLLRRKQYLRQADTAFLLPMAQKFVLAKAEHMRALLQRHNRERQEPALAEATAAVSAALERAPRTTALSSLNGVEGAASAAYFGGLRRLLSPDWKFEKRLRRPPPDPINVLLSFGYTLLAHAAEGAVAAAGLDPYAGFLHAVDYNRPSLALDLMEEFRPLIDGVVLWACNGGQITPADFTPGPAERPVVMSDQARRRFIEAYERRLADNFTHPTLNQKLSIRQCLLAQARQVVEAIQSARPEFKPMGFR
jgi:CRISP-associated protein Cas1